MQTLEEIFKQNTGRRIGRFVHTLNTYDEFFSRYRNTEVRVLEIGITSGGSLLMWKKYFGLKAKIFGLDITNSALDVEDEQIKIFIGDQENKVFLKGLIKELNNVDIIIDDGGHESPQQIASLEELFPILNNNGIYCIEDVHCSYRENYRGGYKNPNSIIEYTKNLIDLFYIEELSEKVEINLNNIFRFVYSVNYFKNSIILEKSSPKYLTHSPLLTGEGTIKDNNHEIRGNRFGKFLYSK